MIDILLYRQWAISEQFFNTFGLRGLNLLREGKDIAHFVKRHSLDELLTRYASLADASEGIVVSTSWDNEARVVVSTTKDGQNVALIPVLGALTKRGDLCSYGMRDYIGMIDRANKSSRISSIVLDIESPGGTVDGTNEFGLAIKQSKKPVVAFGDGMVASAAYWVASQAREIYSNKNNATEFGSIGVLYVHENYQAYIQKEIGSVDIIRAPQSTDKALVNPIEPLTADLRSEIETELGAIAKEFFATVKNGRGDRLSTGDENIFTGKMYPAKVAMKMGMIDKMGSLQEAIDRSGKLSLSSTSGSRASVNNDTMKLTTFVSKTLAALFGRSEKSAEENQAEPTMETIDGKVAELEAENQALKDANAAHEAKIAELEGQVTGLNTQVTTLTSEKADLQTKLDKKPTGQATTVISNEGCRVVYDAIVYTVRK